MKSMEVSFVKARTIDLKHAFFTRMGGVSPPPFDSLNVAKHVGDKTDNADINRARALAELHIEPKHFVFLGRLEHSNRIYEVDAEAGGVELADHDALITQTPGLALGISTADCLPIIIVDEEAPALALVHAGWRGLKVDIIDRAVQALVERFDAEPSRMKAVIGPSVGPDSYEVQSDVARQFDEEYSIKTPTGYNLNLWQIAESQLSDVGVEHVENLHIDVAQDERFFSHRGTSDKTGRFLTVVSL